MGLADDTFNSTQQGNVTLYVPKGCEEVYRNANGWKLLKNISATLDVSEEPETSVTVTADGRGTLMFGDKSLTDGSESVAIPESGTEMQFKAVPDTGYELKNLRLPMLRATP